MQGDLSVWVRFLLHEGIRLAIGTSIGIVLALVGSLVILGIGRINRRLGLWVAVIGFERTLGLVMCVCLVAGLLILVFEAEPSDRLSYIILTIVVGGVFAIMGRRVLLEAREEIERSETGIAPGQEGRPIG